MWVATVEVTVLCEKSSSVNRMIEPKSGKIATRYKNLLAASNLADLVPALFERGKGTITDREVLAPFFGKQHSFDLLLRAC